VEERIPLTTLLSQALVAYTIEFDNEFERQSPHRTTLLGPAGGGGPWLVSMVMWFNCLRHVGETPMTVTELVRRARTRTNLAGMHRWRYIDVEATPDSRRAKPPDDELLVRATRKGRRSQQVLRPLAREIETRWEGRWGIDQLDALRVALRAVVSQIDLDLPDCLPIIHVGLWSAGPERPGFSHRVGAPDDAQTLALPSLLSRALLILAVDFESRSKVSMAIHADLLRVLSAEPTRVRDLPRLTGVSKEAVSMAMGVAVQRGLAVLEQNPNGRAGKAARLTSKGIASQEAHGRLLHKVEEEYVSRYGADVTGALRTSLEALGGDSRGSRLLQGIPLFAEGWRASVPKADTLPHFPMVLHRGGYPDGS
jgi:DNA-binding MarR family transcriptional regulator